MKRIIFFASFVGSLFLLAGVSYFFISPDTKAGAIITGVSATNIIGSGAQIVWTTNIPADSRVAYGITFPSNVSTNTCDGGGLVTSHCVNLTGLSANTVYQYKVESMDANSVDSQLGGYTLTSASSSGDAVAPSIPTGLTPTVISSSQINLSWTASTDNVGVTGYKIYKDGAYVTTVTSGTTYSSTGLAPGTLYNYAVAAVDAANNLSAQSSGANATTQIPADTTAPSIPTGLTPTVISSSQINLSWTASTDNVGVTGYKIYKNSTYVASVTSGTTYSSTGLTAGTSYSYTIATYDLAGNLSGQSVSASATTPSSSDVTAPIVSITAPIAGATVSGITTVSAAASDNIGVVGVQFKLDAVILGAEDMVSPYSTSWSTGGATNGSHTLTAVARDAAGNTTVSSAVTITVSNVSTDAVAPSIPTGLTPTVISSSQINLSWTASTDNVGVTGYKIYKDGAYVTTVTSGTTYSSTGLAPGTLYNYAVAAVDAANNLSAESVATNATTLADAGQSNTSDMTPPVSTVVRAENIISSGAQIKWSTDDLSDSLVRFGVISSSLASNSIWRCDDGGDVTLHCVNLTNLTPGATYYYKVVSKNAYGYEAVSSEYSFVAGSDAMSGTGTTNATLLPVTFSLNVGTPICKDGHTVAPVYFIANPFSGGYFTVNSQKISTASLEFLSGTYNWSGTPYAGYAISGRGSDAFTVSNLDTCSAVTKTATITQGNPRAYIALWQGDINVLLGQAIQGDIRINVGVENAENVSIYLKRKDGTEPVLLGQAIRAAERPSLWRFSWSSKTVSDGDAIVFSRVKNATGEYEGDSVYAILKNSVGTAASATTQSEAASIVNELFNRPENVKLAKTFLAQKINKFLDASSVEEKQRAAEKIRKDLALDILVSDTGSVSVQIGTTTLSRQIEPERVVEEISRAVKNREGASVLEDTDKDTISDYDETYIYNTDSKRADTDGDGVNDGEEILLGMNPTESKIALVSRENPKEVVVAVKADLKKFSVDKIELISGASPENGSTTKQHIAFEGSALPNSFVMLYIFSTPVVVTVKTDSNGKWKYTMDKELEDGNHEVYVAMTESAGKIIMKSDPIPFVKTAQAATLQSNFALAADTSEGTKGFFKGGTLALSLVILFIILGLSFLVISFVSKKKESSDDTNT